MNVQISEPSKQVLNVAKKEWTIASAIASSEPIESMFQHFYNTSFIADVGRASDNADIHIKLLFIAG